MKTAKAKTKRAPKKPDPTPSIDPRLHRVHDLLQVASENIDHETNPVFDQMVTELLERLRGGTSTLEGAWLTIVALAAGVKDDDIADCVEIVERHHRKACFCCRTRAA